jgi:beta-lactamase regulating signal transducer with metallopeptidase domain
LIPVLGRALLHFIWQGALIGLLAAIALQLLRGARPQARYAVACAALLACAVVPLVGVLVQLGGDLRAATTIALVEAPRLAGVRALQTVDAGTWLSRFEGALPLIVALWAAGASVLSLRMAMGVVWIRRLCAAPQGPAHVSWQARLDALAQGFGLMRPVALRLVDTLDSPASAGWWRPVVLLPTALIARMPVDLIEALLAHELAHIRRHDYLVNLLQGMVEALLFYHPVTWWLSRRIRIEREHIADQLAADTTHAPRRLALALSELSEFKARRPARPHLAQAARATHGGHLMSRIQQLIQPGRRAVGGRIAFPLLGLAAACIALYAQAQGLRIENPVTVPRAVAEVPVPAVASGPVLAQRAAVAQVTRIRDDEPRQAFALVRKGQDGINMSGSTDDIEAIKAARDSLDSDFLWFRRADKAYVVVDPATVARAMEAWREVDKLEPQMRALGDQMEVHGDKLEALGAKMEQLASQHQPTPAMDAASRRMEQLGEQQAQLGNRQARLAAGMAQASEAERDALEAQMDSLSEQMDALGEQMDQQSTVLDAEAERLDANQKPMDALSREMDQASKPMEALSTRMDALSKQQEQHVKQAELELQKLVSEALAQGLARPAPGAASKQ